MVLEFAVYAEKTLLPDKITPQLVKQIKDAGWTTVILNFLHVSGQRQNVPPGSILYFNDEKLIIDRQLQDEFKNWDTQLAQFLPDIKLHLSIGGGGRTDDPDRVQDFNTIMEIYGKNKTFEGTDLQKNLIVLYDKLGKVIEAIDMDCETQDCYDVESFTAFCEMVDRIGFKITFAPYDNNVMNTFWAASLAQIRNSWGPAAVERINLQSGATDPQVWVNAFKPYVNDNFLLLGDVCRYKDDNNQWAGGDCPNDVKVFLAGARNNIESYVGGGFIFKMDWIFESTDDPTGCTTSATMSDYVNAIRTAMQAGVTASKQ